MEQPNHVIIQQTEPTIVPIKPERPYRCTFEGCDKAYKKPCRLEEHLRSHTNEVSLYLMISHILLISLYILASFYMSLAKLWKKLFTSNTFTSSRTYT
jgi:hypothetical protein